MSYDRQEQTHSVRKAIIPAAGLGTRLLPATKEQPKEMLALFSGTDGELAFKPVVQMIFEQLFGSGFREFCFVVGRGKRAIEDHFTPDPDFVDLLVSRGKGGQARQLRSFYDEVKESDIVWLNQSKPLGFGHAVLSAKSFVGGETFLVHAGDNHVISAGNRHIRRMLQSHRRTGADATLLLRRVKDPRPYGVADVTRRGREIFVNGVAEKPDKPLSRLALLPTYVFSPIIFEALASIRPGKGGEYQLTDGIQKLIERGSKVMAVLLEEDEFWLDVGNPEAYWRALERSHSHALEAER